jgi:pimeloyl-ACP methyl ester carboxylesterase
MVFGPWFAADPEALGADAVEALLGELDLHDVRCPALVLWGAEDRQLPVDDAFEYARRLRAPLRVIADCGHLPIVERPDACLDAIEEFLAP